MTWSQLLRPETLIFLIPIAAILMAGLTGIVKMLINHRERIAMIQHGLHPDAVLSRESQAEFEDEP